MPDVKSAPMLVSEFTGLEARRCGQPLELSAQQRERVRRGFEVLVREGLAFDGVAVEGVEPVRVRLTVSGPGDCALVASLHDARPLHRRLLSPRSFEEISELAQKLHEAVATVLSGVQMLPIILAARSVVLGAVADELDLVPMVTDGRYVMRVPHNIFVILRSSPQAQAAAEDLKHLFEQDDSTITFVRGKGTTQGEGATVMELPAHLWERLAEAQPASIFESVQQVEDPLESLVTRIPREDLSRTAPSDVGPQERGRRTDERIPPPGHLL
ncbi:hypothetical protein M3E18_05705 [Kocuria sp. p3-SID1433]|uniref:hypothetical protein n=1 Tax=unclassified Kocuria TaxID=2649579 RepID=UPI0021A66EE5|nr:MULTISPECIES: hypothetical protein [unclassified Kocuria]MCT1601370.1 hypothetical protein [Kocuria sp. p3-SID1428]MCT2180038.1 hypothetical protein [Kocuria sp. p3-SID1433]